jgi:nucleoside-diphosphate-sugar epimerase
VLCCALWPPGHVVVERYLESEGLPYTVFQPLYIYGPHTAKDCEQWFVDRIIRWATYASAVTDYQTCD